MHAAWHALSIVDVLAKLGTSTEGLSEDEAAQRLRKFGPNRLVLPATASVLSLLLHQLKSVIVALLVAAVGVSALVGEHLEAAAIAGVLVFNTAMGVVTELRARRAMEALLQLDVPRALVVRSGRRREIDARWLVPGDVIELDAERQVPADARLILATDAAANEAPLTGESLPVPKTADITLADDTPLAERRNMVYKGTTLVTGLGRAVVMATALATEVGRIGVLVGNVVVEPTPLERRLDQLGRRLVWLALAVAALVAALGVLQGMPLALALETAIALAVAAVPEALPAVATMALAVGVHRMARRHALVRRLPAVEALGSTTVICTDKTGTLTAGQMVVVRVWSARREWALSQDAAVPTPLDDSSKRVFEAAALASRPPVVSESGEVVRRGDPEDAAILAAAASAGIDRARLVLTRPQLAVVPFSSERKLMAAFHRVDSGIGAFVKGAPRAILNASGRMLTDRGIVLLDDAGRADLLKVNEAFAERGFRVLAVADGQVADASESALHGLTFLGVIALADPPAPAVKEAIARLREAGLRTVMLTGDQRLTAEAIGRELGLLNAEQHVMDGRELDALPPGDADRTIGRVAAFSRVTPEHKIEIVRALQAHGEIVAMIGDGVNDAPALKQADVGVAMGLRGTDVAKQAASIVLRDDRFATIGAAVEEGRVIFENIRKFVFYLFSCNVAEILVLLLTSLAGLPLPLAPLQLLWLNLVTDTFPALSLAVEPADHDVMRRPPRRPEEAVLSRRFLGEILLYGGLITVAALGAYAWALEHVREHASTVVFMTLALAQVGHLGNARSARAVLRPAQILANPFALAGAGLSVALQLLAVYLPPLAHILHLSPLGHAEWFVILAFAAVPAVIGQLLKLVTSRPA